MPFINTGEDYKRHYYETKPVWIGVDWAGSIFTKWMFSARKSMRMVYREFALKTGIDAARLIDIENGSVKPTPAEWSTIKGVLERSV